MRITYDSSVDAAYVYLIDTIAPGGVKKSISLDPIESEGDFTLDFDGEGRLIGVEVLEAASRLHPDALRQAELIG